MNCYVILCFSDSSHPIVFKPSLVDKPGLPSWLHFIQRDPSDGMGYLYGTPDIESVGDLRIEVKFIVHPIHRFKASDWLKDGLMTWISFGNAHVGKLIHVH